MKTNLRILTQDFNDKNNFGITLRLINSDSGEIFSREPFELMNDLALLHKLHPADALRLGYMIGEYQASLSYKFLLDQSR